MWTISTFKIPSQTIGSLTVYINAVNNVLIANGEGAYAPNLRHLKMAKDPLQCSTHNIEHFYGGLYGTLNLMWGWDQQSADKNTIGHLGK